MQILPILHVGYRKDLFWDLYFSHIHEDMPRTVKSNLFLYADDSCLLFQGKDVIEIEKQLQKYTNQTNPKSHT